MKMIKKLERAVPRMTDDSVCYECDHLYGEQIVDDLYEYCCEMDAPQCGMEYGCYLWERRKEDG